jgi:hypothetical protein
MHALSKYAEISVGALPGFNASEAFTQRKPSSESVFVRKL